MATRRARKTRSRKRPAKKPTRKRSARRKTSRTARRPKKRAVRKTKRVSRRPKQTRKRTVRRKTRKTVRKRKPLVRARTRARPKRGLHHHVRKVTKKLLIGRVSHYYNGVGVGVVELNATLALGDRISIEGATTNLTQKVNSIHINRRPVTSARSRESIGLKVTGRVREGDRVFKV